MGTSHFADHDPRRKTPWNKGKFTGAKPPFQPKHVWAIRTRLEIANRTRDLALFNVAIDSKLRGCDVVSLKVEDVARTATPWIGQRSASRRQAALSDSKSPSRRGRRSTTIWLRHDPPRATIYFKGGVAIATSQRANTRGCSPNGCR